MAKPHRGGLGRGLKGLLGDDVSMVQMEGLLGDKSDAPAVTGDAVTEMDMSLLQAGKYQPRSKMEMEKLEELSASIKEQGVISPIIVRPIGGGRYEIIAGERRFRASQLAGKTKIPAIVRELDDKTTLAVALIENMQREDLNVMEEAVGVKRLIDEFGFTHEEAAKAIGRSRPATSNLLRLLNLAEPVQKMVSDGRLEMGHARALLSLSGADQVLAATEISRQGSSVRQAEKLVANWGKDKEKEVKPKKAPERTKDDEILERRLSDALAAPVHVNVGRRGKGQIVIDFADLDDLQAIIEKLLPDGENDA